jgi:hypothetical protein
MHSRISTTARHSISFWRNYERQQASCAWNSDINILYIENAPDAIDVVLKFVKTPSAQKSGSP